MNKKATSTKESSELEPKTLELFLYIAGEAEH
jgi:hypothetical protein